MADMDDHYDVLIIGAGVSGISAACHLTRQHPHRRVGILERRERIGGTWDLFRYPGIRSDSDMLSFGFGFRPWNELRTLADGPSIREYVRDTARQYGLEERIRFGLRTTRAEWNSRRGCWRVTAVHEPSAETWQLTADFLIGATGYYSYDRGYLPGIPGMERFRGRFIHPQHWPEDLDYRGKRVLVVGSGATAVTLVPAMADETAHVTMLQRSPSYILSIPAFDQWSADLRRVLPAKWVYALGRTRNIFIQRLLYIAAKRWPERTRRFLLEGVRKRLRADIDMRHFTPRYRPWDERLCAVPDGDLFRALNEDRASIVTDEIETFTENGIRLKSGGELEGDIVIMATGLQVQVLGGMEVFVDGERVEPSRLMTYKAVLMQDIPNMAWIFGYINTSWTLKADLAARYICRLLHYMDTHGVAVAVPRAPEGMAQPDETVMDALKSGYVRRARHSIPRQGRELPWHVLHSYGRDKKMLLKGPIDDGHLELRRASAGTRASEQPDRGGPAHPA